MLVLKARKKLGVKEKGPQTIRWAKQAKTKLRKNFTSTCMIRRAGIYNAIN